MAHINENLINIQFALNLDVHSTHHYRQDRTQWMVSPFIYTVAAQKRIIEFGWQGQYAIYRIKQLYQTPRLNVLVWWCCAWVAIRVRKNRDHTLPLYYKDDSFMRKVGSGGCE